MSEELEKDIESEESDYDLDDEHFNIYREDSVEEPIDEKFLSRENAEVNNLKSKFTPAEEEIKQISELKGEIRKAAINIIAHLSDSIEIKRYYGLLKTFYISFKTIIDGVVIKDLDPKFRDIKLLLKKMREEGKTPPSLYEKLSDITEDLFKVSQYKGLGMIVEKVGMSSNATKRIVGEQ